MSSNEHSVHGRPIKHHLEHHKMEKSHCEIDRNIVWSTGQDRSKKYPHVIYDKEKYARREGTDEDPDFIASTLVMPLLDVQDPDPDVIGRGVTPD